MEPKMQSRQELDLDEAFYRAFQSSHGKIVYEVLETAYQNEVVFTPGDPYMTSYKDGQRSVFLQIKKRRDSYLNRDNRKKE